MSSSNQKAPFWRDWLGILPWIVTYSSIMGCVRVRRENEAAGGGRFA
jgi:hypothetical protein